MMFQWYYPSSVCGCVCKYRDVSLWECSQYLCPFSFSHSLLLSGPNKQYDQTNVCLHPMCVFVQVCVYVCACEWKCVPLFWSVCCGWHVSFCILFCAFSVVFTLFCTYRHLCHELSMCMKTVSLTLATFLFWKVYIQWLWILVTQPNPQIKICVLSTRLHVTVENHSRCCKLCAGMVSL